MRQLNLSLGNEEGDFLTIDRETELQSLEGVLAVAMCVRVENPVGIWVGAYCSSPARSWFDL